MLERRAQPIRLEIPDAHLAVCHAGDDRVRLAAGRPSRCGRAIDDADDVDKGNGFDAPAVRVRVAAQGQDGFALAQADDADAAFCATGDGDGRCGVEGERGDAAEVGPGVVSGWLVERGGRAWVPVDEGVVGAHGHDAFAWGWDQVWCRAGQRASTKFLLAVWCELSTLTQQPLCGLAWYYCDETFSTSTWR